MSKDHCNNRPEGEGRAIAFLTVAMALAFGMSFGIAFGIPVLPHDGIPGPVEVIVEPIK